MAGAWLDPFRLCLHACDERCEEYFVTADKTLLIDVSQLSAATCHTGLRGYRSTMLQMRMARRMKVGFASLIAVMVCNAAYLLAVAGVGPQRRRLGFLCTRCRVLFRSSDPRLHGRDQGGASGSSLSSSLPTTIGASPSELDGAIEDYDQAIRLMPDYYVAINNRGVALMARGELDLAIAAFGGRAAFGRKGVLDRAIVDLDVIIKADPKNVAVIYERGKIRAKSGDKVGAESDFHRAESLGFDSDSSKRPR
jgi:hypothetical protein